MRKCACFSYQEEEQVADTSITLFNSWHVVPAQQIDDRETFKEVLYFIILLRKPYTRMNWMNLLPEIWDRTSLGTKDSPVLVIKAFLTMHHFGRTTCSSANIDLIYNLQSLCFSKRRFRNLFLIVFPLFQIVVNLQVINVLLFDFLLAR